MRAVPVDQPLRDRQYERRLASRAVRRAAPRPTFAVPAGVVMPYRTFERDDFTHTLRKRVDNRRDVWAIFNYHPDAKKEDFHRADETPSAQWNVVGRHLVRDALGMRSVPDYRHIGKNLEEYRGPEPHTCDLEWPEIGVFTQTVRTPAPPVPTVIRRVA